MHRGLIALLCGLCVSLLALTGCGLRQHDGPFKPSKPPVTNPQPAETAAGGETIEQAAQRLYEAARKEAMAGTFHPDVLRVATLGQPLPVSEGYVPSEVPAPWVLLRDAESAKTGMFKAMISNHMSTRHYIIPILKDGRPISEFSLWFSDSGWSPSDFIDLTDPDAGGDAAYIADASAQLQRRLGTGTEVRTALFLPSGLVFVVGNNDGREAAVYLTFVNGGPGVGSFDKFLPDLGSMYNPSDLAALLTP